MATGNLRYDIELPGGFPDASVFQGMLGKDCSIKFKLRHELTPHGLDVELEARAVRIVRDQDRDEEFGKVETFTLNGREEKGGKLYRTGYSAHPMPQRWVEKVSMSFDQLLDESTRRPPVSYLLEELCQKMVTTMVKQVLYGAVDEILESLPPDTARDAGKKFQRTGRLQAFDRCRRRSEHDYQTGAKAFLDAARQIPRGEMLPVHNIDYEKLERQVIASSKLDADGKPTGYFMGVDLAAAKAQADGSSKLPIDKMTQPCGGCDKTFATCRDRFQNEVNFSHQPVPGERLEDVRCVHLLGDKACGIDMTMTPPGEAMRRLLGEASIPVPGGEFASIKNGTDLVYKDRVVGKVVAQIHDEFTIEITDSDFKKLWGNADKVRMPSEIGLVGDEIVDLEMEVLQGASPDCGVCWGTGFCKGAGAPCTEGCKPPSS